MVESEAVERKETGAGTDQSKLSVQYPAKSQTRDEEKWTNSVLVVKTRLKHCC